MIRSVFLATLLLLATFYRASPIQAAANLDRPTFTCNGATATLRFTWQPDPAAIEQWLDLSTMDNGFKPGTFLSHGPLVPTAASDAWPGITADLRHFFRLNTLTTAGWSTSSVESFRAPCLPAEVSLGGADAPFSLYPGLYVLDMATSRLQTIADLRGSRIDDFYQDEFDWSPDGTKLVLNNGGNGVEVYPAAGGPMERRIDLKPFAVDWLASGQIAALTEGNLTKSYTLFDPASGASTNVPAPLQSYGATWSPDGRQVIFPGQGPDSHDLVITDVATGESRVLADGYFMGTAWSPDGTRIASYKSRGTGSEFDLIIYDVASGRELTRLDYGNGISWSPDGKWIASIAWQTPEVTQSFLRIQATDGSISRTLGAGERFTWSPDSAHIAFLRQGQLWVVSTESGQEATLLRPQLPVIGEPRWSPDGSRIAFRAVGSGGGVYTIGVDGSNERYLAPGFDPEWSPKGDRIAFVMGQGGTGFGGALYTMNLDSSRIRRLAEVFYSDAIHPCTARPSFAWSPDGSNLAYWSTLGRPGDILFTVADKAGAKPLGIGVGFGPAWSPDGKRITFTGLGDTPGFSPCGLRIAGADGESDDLLLANASSASWSKDGERVATQLRTATTSNIVALATDGSGRQLSLGVGSAPQWSPTGEYVSYRGSRPVFNPPLLLPPDAISQPPVLPPDATSPLMVVRADGSGQRVLADVILGDWAWSPDGKQIAYTAYESTRREVPSIFVIGVEGTAAPRLLTSGSSPSWSPDGKRLAFTR